MSFLLHNARVPFKIENGLKSMKKSLFFHFFFTDPHYFSKKIDPPNFIKIGFQEPPETPKPPILRRRGRRSKKVTISKIADFFLAGRADAGLYTDKFFLKKIKAFRSY